jgi:hypothetical protein
MVCSRFREQDGLIRGALLLFVVVAAIAVIILDALGVFSAYQNVRSDAHDAAVQANHAYVQFNSVSAGEQHARDLLRANGDKVISVRTRIDLTVGPDPIFVVTAERPAHTYVLKYAVHLPLIGKAIARLLSQSATRDSSQ